MLQLWGLLINQELGAFYAMLSVAGHYHTTNSSLSAKE